MYRQAPHGERQQTCIHDNAGETRQIEESEHGQAEEATHGNGHRIRGVGTRTVGGRITNRHERRRTVGRRVVQMMEEGGPVPIEE